MIKMLKAAALLIIAAGSTQCNTPIKESEMKTNANTPSAGKEIIVDVRTKEEWNYDGHSDCSVNYPLDQFDAKIPELINYDKVTIVCRSGSRAEMAKMKLISAGYRNTVENMGSWKNVSCAN